MTDAKDLWWRCGLVGAAVMALGCSPPEPGDEDGGEGPAGPRRPATPWFRNGSHPGADDGGHRGAAAPARRAESRSEAPLLVFTPAQLPDETIEGVLLVVGGELTATTGQLRGVEEEKVEEIDGSSRSSRRRARAAAADPPRCAVDGARAGGDAARPRDGDGRGARDLRL
jgi:hypothetical protein